MDPFFPLLELTPSGLFMGLSSTIIYTSELILCSTICVSSATRLTRLTICLSPAYGTLRNETKRNGTLRNGTLRNGTLRNGTLRNGTLRNGTL